MRKRDLEGKIVFLNARVRELESALRLEEVCNAMLGLSLRKRERERREAVRQIDIILGTINPLTQQAQMLQGLRATLIEQAVGDLP